MTDAIQATGEVSLVENFSNDTAEMTQNVVQQADAIEAVEPVAELPNGFVALGLAPELIQAVKDLGFTQPTTVQLKTIPIAMQGHGAADEAARFTDLMVSSQTGSGKTAAFLLPVLHTLLMQMA
ncbi:MAG: DEAD/DEAH box helicase, partial [Rhodoferax sp.]|uniref:DEAD/DEAH box helicase n=1 Tax=Rhodoferax sp. TaxID=50421 RepID=UPI003016A6B2